ncbi:MAG: hypothetical protein LBB48_04445 [Treponema sp.]|nr:hypothetical protein [Treponema sp.]
MVAWADSEDEGVVELPSSAPYSAIVLLYDSLTEGVRWTGSGTYDVYLVIGGTAHPLPADKKPLKTGEYTPERLPASGRMRRALYLDARSPEGPPLHRRLSGLSAGLPQTRQGVFIPSANVPQRVFYPKARLFAGVSPLITGAASANRLISGSGIRPPPAFMVSPLCTGVILV